MEFAPKVTRLLLWVLPMRSSPVFALVMIVALSGCERRVDKAFDPVVLSRVPVPESLVATVTDRQIDLAWSVDAADLPLVARYLVYRADSGGSAYRVVDSVTVRNYSDVQLANDVRYSYRVSIRDTKGVEGESSGPATAIPTLISVRINGDSLYTSRLNVLLESTVAGASFMRLANDTTQPGSWLPFRTSQNWTLSSGVGLKRVFAQFRLSGGVESSGWVSDEIEFDDRAEVLSVTVSDSVLTPGASMNVFVATGEPGGAATYALGARSDQKLFDDGVVPDVAAGDGVYSGVYVATSLDLFESATLTAQFRDKAGNRATDMPAPWVVSVRQPPDPPVWLTIEAVAGDPAQLNLSWYMGQAKPFSQMLLRRDTLPGGGLNAPVVRSFTTASTTTVRDTGLTASSTYYYTLQVVLSNGLQALSTEGSGTTVDDLPPSAVTVAVTPTADSSLVLSWTRSTVSDFADYRVYRADSSSQLQGIPVEDLLVDIVPEQDSTSYTETGLSRFYYYRVFVFDRGGRSAGSNTVWGPKVFGP